MDYFNVTLSLLSLKRIYFQNLKKSVFLFNISAECMFKEFPREEEFHISNVSLIAEAVWKHIQVII